MNGILFLIFGLGGAALHTLFDLKIKPRLKASDTRADNRTY